MPKLKFVNDDDDCGRVTTVEIDAATSDDVVDAFYHFMLGITYSPAAIAGSFHRIAHEHEDTSSLQEDEGSDE